MVQATIKYTQYGKSPAGNFYVNDNNERVDLADNDLHSIILREFSAYHADAVCGTAKTFTYSKETGRREMEWADTYSPLTYLINPAVSKHVIVTATYYSWGANIRIIEQAIRVQPKDVMYEATVVIRGNVPDGHSADMAIPECVKLMCHAINERWVDTEYMSTLSLISVTDIKEAV